LVQRHGDTGPEAMTDQDPCPAEPGGAATHRLGPLEFDRADLVYFATCTCGRRFGPLASVVSLQAAFEHHRASLDQPLDPPGPLGV
jgi:hypothetical protein